MTGKLQTEPPLNIFVNCIKFQSCPFQELATHIGEVVINKCFCTRRNPISISAAAIYLACQLEDKRKTQAEICKITGLTEVTLRKVYKELLENWDDLLPSNYTPAIPPEKAFPTTVISSGRSSAPKVDQVEVSPSLEKPNDVLDTAHQVEVNLNRAQNIWQSQIQFGSSGIKTGEKKSQTIKRGIDVNGKQSNSQEVDDKADKETKAGLSSSIVWPFCAPPSSGQSPPFFQFGQASKLGPGLSTIKGSGSHNGSENGDQ